MNDFKTTPMLQSTWWGGTALKTDGTVWTWGTNQYGYLGESSSVTQDYVPKNRVKLTEIVQIHARYHAQAALSKNGTAYLWGGNNNGQLGLGISDTNYHHQPILLTDDSNNTISGIKRIKLGNFGGLALLSDATVLSWGKQEAGILGNGESSNRISKPVKVLNENGTDELKRIIDIVATGYYAVNYALSDEGYVYSWGNALYGGIGSTDNEINARPHKVLTQDGLPLRDIIAIGDTIALKSDGTVWVWGSNQYGQLGNGNEDASTSPYAIKVEGLSNITSLYDENGFTKIARDKNNYFYGWGNNQYTQLGYTNLEPFFSPNVTPIFSEAVDLSNNNVRRILFYKSDGTVWINGHGAQRFATNTGSVSANVPVPIQVFVDTEPFLLWEDGEGPDPGPDPGPNPEPGDCCCKCCGPRVHFDIPANMKYGDSIRRFLDEIEEINVGSCKSCSRGPTCNLLA